MNTRSGIWFAFWTVVLSPCSLVVLDALCLHSSTSFLPTMPLLRPLSDTFLNDVSTCIIYSLSYIS